MPVQQWIPAFAGMTNAIIDRQVHYLVMTQKNLRKSAFICVI